MFLRTSPSGELDHVLDVAIGCGPRPLVLLQPGESIANHVQVFFTNQGVTFTTPGRHTVVAQLEADAMTTVHSEPVTIDIRTPASDAEVSISAKTLTKGVGRALALGDFANDEVARAVLTDLAESHSDTDTGAASALVMANSLARSFTDYRADDTRKAAPKEAAHFLDLAVRGRSCRACRRAGRHRCQPDREGRSRGGRHALPRSARTNPRRTQASAKAKAEGAAELAGAERIAENFARPQAR